MLALPDMQVRDCALKFYAANLLDLGLVLDCLKDLSYIGQMMITQIHPVVSLYRVWISQYGYSGNVICFKQNIESFISCLPINRADMSSTVLVTRNTLSECAEFSSCSQLLLEAFRWFNPCYSNIINDEDLLATLPWMMMYLKCYQQEQQWTLLRVLTKK